MTRSSIALLIVLGAIATKTGRSEEQPAQPIEQVQAAPSVQPYRTFVTIQRYSVEHNGSNEQPISNVKLEIMFPGGAKAKLPESGDYWPVGNGQSQEINRTFEVPYSVVQSDGFKFSIQMIRKGSKILPCEFDVTQLSQFNRGYICKTDVAYQTNKGLSEDKLDKEGIQIRVFTDRNSPAKDIPQNAIAIR